MTCAKPHSILRLMLAVSAVFLLTFSAFAEDDPNPDSPTPVLISQKDSVRALANLKGDPMPNVKSAGNSIKNFREEPATPFEYNSKIVIYLTNIELMNGEDANAFRAYIVDQEGRRYRFPVTQIEQLKDYNWVYALTIDLKDEVGFWKEQPASGDVLLRVTWRGLTTNRVLLGIGKTGGKIEADKDSAPTPFPQEPLSSNPPTSDAVGYRWSGDRIRFLEQATFGPTVATDDRLRRIGLRIWLVEQFDAPYPSAGNPYPDLPLLSTTQTTGCPSTDPNSAICVRDNYTLYPLQNWFFKEALYGDAQLRHRVAWALSQIWVVSGVDTQQTSWMVAYHQQLSKNAFGNYRTLMKDVTLNPAMGNYLDMLRSSRTSPNENYAREILQLFSIGLFMLNQDGTLQLDNQGRPIPTYDQTTVNNFTKIFTGWRNCEDTALCPNRTNGAPNYKDPMLLTQSLHDVTAKTLLTYPNSVSTSIPANQNGNTDLDQALDNIFNHPNVAPFVSKQLIQHLVTSDPSPAYVGRISAVFNNNGQNVRGDLKAVVKAILLDPEARGNVKTDPNFGKLREPVQFITNLLKHLNVKSADLSQQSDGVINNQITGISQDVLRAPTVFNYYPPNFNIPGTSLIGPEFGILTTGTAIGRLNRVNTFVFGRINASQPNTPLGTSVDLSEMVALATADTTSNRLVDTLNNRMMHGAMSASMKNTIVTAVNTVASNNPTLRAQTAVYLVASSSQYQIQR